jgi:hypothetical protein
MNLTELQASKKVLAQKALKEHYETDINLDNMTAKSTRAMLNRVRGLISESHTGASQHTIHSNPAYLKLIMMEQMLSQHYSDLRVQPSIVVENEEVQKSQVILAAQDMIDTIQKMMEQISKMNVEELPAVVTGVSNEIGTTESEQFNQSVGQALTTLLQSLTTTKSELTNSMNQLTGTESGFDAEAGSDTDMSADLDLDTDMDSDESDLDMDLDSEEEELPELPELDDLGGAGRELR